MGFLKAMECHSTLLLVQLYIPLHHGPLRATTDDAVESASHRLAGSLLSRQLLPLAVLLAVPIVFLVVAAGSLLAIT